MVRVEKNPAPVVLGGEWKSCTARTSGGSSMIITLDQGDLRITYNDTLDFRRPVVFAVHCAR